jgi:hypothetical protein
MKMEGEREKWKNLQNKDKKSMASLNTNRHNLYFKLSKVWRDNSPASLSQTISILQRKVHAERGSILHWRGPVSPVFRHRTADESRARTEIPRQEGQTEL